MTSRRRVLFVFLDGVGIGADDADVNPFAAGAARLEGWAGFMADAPPTLDAPRSSGPRGYAFPLDATLGMDGTPQSGTGQVALLTGESAAEHFGRHFGPWTPVSLRPVVEERSVLRRARDRGLTVGFANAYPRGWPGPAGGRRLAGPPLAARGAGVLDRHENALARGLAVASEIVNDGWIDRLGHASIPRINPRQAGANLAAISAEVDLTLYAHYATDTAGHRKDMGVALKALARVDDFLSGILDALAADTLLLVTSDHGNLEDVRAGHTRNPALGMAAGPGAEDAATLTDIRDVASFVLDFVGSGRR